MKVSESYPLPDKERRLIVQNIVVGDGIMIVLGLLLGVVTTAFAHGTWSYALAGSGWWHDLAATLVPHPAMVVLPVALLVAFQIADRLLWPRSEGYRAQVLRIRQGMTGELPRMSPALLLALFALVGFSEELLFRYGICGFVLQVCKMALPIPEAGSAAVAVIVSAAVFTLAHVQYKSTFGTAVVFCIGVLFGAVFLATGSYLAVAVAHWLYDFGDTMTERFRISRDPDYYAGEVPVDALGRELAASRRR